MVQPLWIPLVYPKTFIIEMFQDDFGDKGLLSWCWWTWWCCLWWSCSSSSSLPGWRGQRQAAQATNDKMEALIESKLIQFNIDKSCFLILGSKKARTQLQTELTTYPLTLCDFTLKESLLIGSNQSLISAKTTPPPTHPPPSTNFSQSLFMLLTRNFQRIFLKVKHHHPSHQR